jgi:hypothetical protein
MAHDQVWIQAPYMESSKRPIEGVWIQRGCRVCWHVMADTDGKGFIDGYTVVQRTMDEKLQSTSFGSR